MNGTNDKYVVLDKISKSYGENKVLNNLSLKIGKNSVVAIVGLSGCGKTTLLNIMSGILEPDVGKVYLDSKDITGKPGFMSYMMQKDLLLEYRSIIDNVAIPLVIKGERKKKARAQVKKYFRLFGLESVENMYPQELSGGMRQRIALMRTYVATDKVALLDEPFASLDELTKKNIYKWLEDVIKKVELTTVIITHDINEALHLSDKIYVLDKKTKNLIEIEKKFCKDKIVKLMMGECADDTGF